jgi:hypothetical protein
MDGANGAASTRDSDDAVDTFVEKVFWSSGLVLAGHSSVVRANSRHCQRYSAGCQRDES